MEGDEQEPEEEGLPGPPPDPSRIPSIVRKVGDLNLQSDLVNDGHFVFRHLLIRLR